MTDDWYNAGRVTFSDDGKYLLLSSSRDFKPTFGEEEFQNVYVDMQRVYLVTLAKETASPLAPKSDEVGKNDKEAGKKSGGPEKDNDKDAKEEKPSP